MSTRHSLLDRQLARSGITDPNVPPSAEAWAEFLEQVNAAYTQADQDRYRLERSLSVSTREMQEEINARERAQTALEEARKNLEEQNRHLERVNGWFRTIMEQMMLTVRRGANSN